MSDAPGKVRSSAAVAVCGPSLAFLGVVVSMAFGGFLAAPGCSPSETPAGDAAPRAPSAEAVSASDARKHEVRLPRPAERIVSLAPSNTEIVFALGAGDRLVGRDPWSDYPPAASLVRSIGDIYPRPNLEAIVLLEPDLVLGAGVTTGETAMALEELGIPVYVASRPTSLEDVWRDLEHIGDLLGRAAPARQLLAELRSRVAAVRERTRSLADSERPRVLYELDATDPARPWTAGQETLVDELIALAGGRNIAHAAGDGYFALGLEAVVLADPEIILLGSARHGGIDVESVSRRPGWSAVSAVVNSRVYPWNDDLVSRPGPRIAAGLEALARLLHPERFSTPERPGDDGGGAKR